VFGCSPFVPASLTRNLILKVSLSCKAFCFHVSPFKWRKPECSVRACKSSVLLIPQLQLWLRPWPFANWIVSSTWILQEVLCVSLHSVKVSPITTSSAFRGCPFHARSLVSSFVGLLSRFRVAARPNVTLTFAVPCSSELGFSN
jgi:hypothetical protein